MNIQKARSILEVNENSSEEEIKKQYKRLAKIKHPDNKETGDEAKFKELAEAYQVIQNPEPDHHAGFDHNPFADISSFFNFSHQKRNIQVDNINVYLEISFKEAVLGCQKPIKYTRDQKCEKCKGQGKYKKDNGCQKCKGKGVIVNQQNSMVYTTTCPDCRGKSNTETCKLCKDGTIATNINIMLSIPPGIINGNVLRLQGAGNYVGQFIADQYNDLFAHLTVIPQDKLRLEGDHVITDISISLLEALTGCEKTVETINGQTNVTINPRIKNKDEIIIPKLGVLNKGDEKVIINIEYPEDVNKIIEILTQAGVNK